MKGGGELLRCFLENDDEIETKIKTFFYNFLIRDPNF